MMVYGPSSHAGRAGKEEPNTWTISTLPALGAKPGGRWFPRRSRNRHNQRSDSAYGAHRKLLRRRLRDLADEAGCSESLLSRIENGLVVPSLSTLHRISKALGVNVAVLVSAMRDTACTIYGPQDRPRTSIDGCRKATARPRRA